MGNDDTVLYPISDLQTTATTQRKALNDAWQNHQAHLNQYILAPAATLFKDPADTFHSHMTSWNQTLQEHYQALHTFLDTLDTSATKMKMLDTNISNDFKGFE